MQRCHVCGGWCSGARQCSPLAGETARGSATSDEQASSRRWEVRPPVLRRLAQPLRPRLRLWQWREAQRPQRSSTSIEWCPSLFWLTRPAPAMGSLGWARCYWCGEWEEGMYIMDGVDHPLCELCSDRWEPPQPDARARLAKELECIFPARVAWEIAELTHHWHEP